MQNTRSITIHFCTTLAGRPVVVIIMIFFLLFFNSFLVAVMKRLSENFQLNYYIRMCMNVYGYHIFRWKRLNNSNNNKNNHSEERKCMCKENKCHENYSIKCRKRTAQPYTHVYVVFNAKIDDRSRRKRDKWMI